MGADSAQSFPAAGGPSRAAYHSYRNQKFGGRSQPGHQPGHHLNHARRLPTRDSTRGRVESNKQASTRPSPRVRSRPAAQRSWSHIAYSRTIVRMLTIDCNASRYLQPTASGIGAQPWLRCLAPGANLSSISLCHSLNCTLARPAGQSAGARKISSWDFCCRVDGCGVHTQVKPRRLALAVIRNTAAQRA
jgi:hypothetical protein